MQCADYMQLFWNSITFIPTKKEQWNKIWDERKVRGLEIFGDFFFAEHHLFGIAHSDTAAAEYLDYSVTYSHYMCMNILAPQGAFAILKWGNQIDVSPTTVTHEKCIKFISWWKNTSAFLRVKKSTVKSKAYIRLINKTIIKWYKLKGTSLQIYIHIPSCDTSELNTRKNTLLLCHVRQTPHSTLTVQVERKEERQIERKVIP